MLWLKGETEAKGGPVTYQRCSRGLGTGLGLEPRVECFP